MTLVRTLVSIGVPVHNGGAHLDRALGALRQQDHTDLEIVVCENASTDDSLTIAQRHAAADPRVRVESSQALLGAVDNFNRCFALTTGDYFMWAAHDDAFAPDYVRKCLAALVETGLSACTTDAVIIDAEGSPVSTRNVDRRVSSRDPRDRLRAHARARDWLEVYALYRRSALPAEPMVVCPGPDVRLTWQILLGGPIAIVGEPLLRYRRTGTMYKTALESFTGMMGGQGRRALSGLNARLWHELWATADGPNRRVARQELVLALPTKAWLRRLRDDVLAERALRSRTS
jgi:glycosyltransferase involved in cell wall biosynthesis